MKKSLEEFQDEFGIRFKDPKLLEQALTHASTRESKGGDNERLEFLGDAVLSLVVTENLFLQVPELSEGEMTERKGAVVSRAELARIAEKKNLARWIKVGKGIEGKSLPRSILANTIEAVLGAYYLDAGLNAVKRFTLPLLAESIERLSKEARNFKMELQNFAQRTKGALPKYKLVNQGGPSHARSFQVQAILDGKEFPPAWGKTKKEAEQGAAREALLVIQSEIDGHSAD